MPPHLEVNRTVTIILFGGAPGHHGGVTGHTLHLAGAGLPKGVQGAADPHFACATRAFSSLFPGRRFGGGALSVYLDGQQVVDVWMGWADRRGDVPWSADTGAMVFSVTKGVAATVVHRLVDRGLLDYDAPVAEFWPEFGANGKAAITIRDVMRHRAGLSHLNGVTRAELMDHRVMEERLAAAPAGRLVGKPAYHALTFGWLVSGLGRAVTGMGMRELFRMEVARPLNTDGLHLGRPPAAAPTQAAQILAPQGRRVNPVLNFIAPKLATMPFAAGFGALYFPGMKATVQGNIPFLDAEAPSVNGVATARALAKMYGALANGGRIDGAEYLSAELTRSLAGRPNLRPDRNILFPLAWHQGYHAVPFPGVLPGFGHAGLGGSIGWADPQTGMSFGFVHNRLLTPMLLDQASFVGLAALLRLGAEAARKHGAQAVPHYGAPYLEPSGQAAGYPAVSESR